MFDRAFSLFVTILDSYIAFAKCLTKVVESILRGMLQNIDVRFLALLAWLMCVHCVLCYLGGSANTSECVDNMAHNAVRMSA